MTFSEIVYMILIQPLQLVFEVIFGLANNATGDPGIAIVVLSLVMNILVLPLYMRADAMQEEERILEQKLQKGVAHIKRTFHGDERMMMLQTYYRQNGYKPTDVFKNSLSLFLEIPFFIAAYQFLSNLTSLNGISWGLIRDLGAPDALFQIGDTTINVLPIIMTIVNLISCILFTKGHSKKTKLQLYGMACFFCVFLYESPAGLVFYWTLNNIFSLVKTIFYKLKNPKKVLKIGSVLAAVLLLCLAVKIRARVKYAILLAFVGLVLLTWMFLEIADKFLGFRIQINVPKTNKSVFLSGTIYLTVLTGILITSSVIASSPQEFIDQQNWLNPLWYVVSSFCLAGGGIPAMVSSFLPIGRRTISEIF